MIVMFSNSFYSEFELYKTKENLNSTISAFRNAFFNGVEMNKEKYKLICSQDDINVDIAKKITDYIVFTDNFI